MPRLSMNEMTTFRWSFEEDVAQYAAAGFTAMGVWRQKLSDFGEEKGIELFAQAEDGRLQFALGRRIHRQRWPLRSARASTMPSRPFAWPRRCMPAAWWSTAAPGPATRTATRRRLLRDAFRELVRVADDYDVTLAIEPMHAGCAAEWTFLTNLDEALALIDAAESPRVKLAFDTYHLGLEPDIVGRIPALAGRIAVVHLGDSKEQPDGESNRCRLGEGTIPLAEIVTALESAGYSGFYDVELMGEDIEAVDYRELLEHSRQAFQRILDA